MSFSSSIKSELSSAVLKKNCCRRAFINGALLFGGVCSDSNVTVYMDSRECAELCSHLIGEHFGRTASLLWNGRSFLLIFESKAAASFVDGFKHSKTDSNTDLLNFRCPECCGAFFRGAFAAGGTITSPEKSYHLELKSRALGNIQFAADILARQSIEFKSSKRLDRHTLYVKDSSSIEDFLFYIGAGKHAFEFVNAKISHEIRNDINRRTNCETGNIARTTTAAARHLQAIRLLEEHGRLSELGPELEYTAKMRLENPEQSLAGLGQMMTPAVSKSGLYHRLEKICLIAEKLFN